MGLKFIFCDIRRLDQEDDDLAVTVLRLVTGEVITICALMARTGTTLHFSYLSTRKFGNI